MNNIRAFLGWDKAYYSFNREERNLSALLYYALLINNNAEHFLEAVDCSTPIDPTQFAIYFEYAYLRDLWHNIENIRTRTKVANQKKRDFILKTLALENNDDLYDKDIVEFNKFFGVTNPSRQFVQSPSNWSIKKFPDQILRHSYEFLKICKFKWAFNIKPDIVIHSSNNNALCIETKLESRESKYPTDSEEKKIFKNLGIPMSTQTELQKYLMEEILGIETKFIFLTKHGGKVNLYNSLSWKNAFSYLNLYGAPIFVLEWVKHLNEL